MEEETPKQNGEKRDFQDPVTGRFLPGTVPNPSGRPKGSVSIVAELRKRLQEIPVGEKRTYLELFTDRVMEKAMVDGDVAMMRDMIDRIDGKPQASVDMTTNGKDLPTPILGSYALPTNNSDEQSAQNEQEN